MADLAVIEVRLDNVETAVAKHDEIIQQLVQSQIKQINKDIEEIIGKPINEELWDLIQSLIIKTNQYYNLSQNETKELLKSKVKPIVKKYKEEMRI